METPVPDKCSPQLHIRYIPVIHRLDKIRYSGVMNVRHVEDFGWELFCFVEGPAADATDAPQP
jgi:hypothetical protein